MEKIMLRITYSMLGLAFIGGWTLRGRVDRAELLSSHRRERYYALKLDENEIECTEFDNIALDNM